MLTPLALGLGGALAVLLVVVIVRTVRFRSRQSPASTDTPPLSVREGAAERLGGAVRFETITDRDPEAVDEDAYEGLYDYLEETFPAVHDRLDVERVNGLSRLYTWHGENPERAPIVLMAHVDVVPVDEKTWDQWTHPPFSGAVADGHVWGRGSLDDKASAVGILEAIETLIEGGFEPERTVYVAIGHDEEVGGMNGAKPLAERIAETGQRPAMVLDEGGAITVGAIPTFEKPLALVGIAEKGYLSVQVTAEAEGGHSSVPPDETSIGVVTRAVRRLRDRPLPARLDGVTGTTFDYIAPEMNAAARAAFANLWLTQPLVTWALSQTPPTDASIRTTTAPTILDAGVKDNVVPSKARAVVNFRILPTQSVADVWAHVENALEGLPVTLEALQEGEPTPVSRTDDDWFEMLQQSIHAVSSDEVVVAPYLVPGTTDSRHHGPYSERVFRFAPFRLTQDDKERIHGVDERIPLDDYHTMVSFYGHIIRSADALVDPDAGVAPAAARANGEPRAERIEA
jgi:carboxypeptidase PM20D1